MKPDMDDAYANGAYIEGAADYPPRWAAEAEAFRTSLGARARLGLSYGPSERMALDHFMPEGEARGTLIFVHGGYWLKFDRSCWSHLAAGALARGWCVAMPSYDLCPHVRIAGITQQIAQAVMAVADGSMGPISLAGHSAGGHLVSRMLAPGMLPASVTSRLTHVLPISPVSDLEPLLQTAMNADFGMDTAMARAESPVHQPKPGTPVTVWVGADERPVFLDQARWLAEAWDVDPVVTQGAHHFDVIDALTDPHGDMIRRLTTAL
ncbi:alpha/beta hydrolase [uncultured Tateyamaria sp.]|uniref:alpha/beta hydrolase n=1 Tax=uncultured Tateyamaria sp. TaxID=455651 RepID=UPI00262E04E6|nr:alpha/beta hydrolase [uncultured Tateyamaria sp.]